jgi:hypothetical protein
MLTRNMESAQLYPAGTLQVPALATGTSGTSHVAVFPQSTTVLRLVHSITASPSTAMPARAMDSTPPHICRSLSLHSTQQQSHPQSDQQKAQCYIASICAAGQAVQHNDLDNGTSAC